MLFIRNNLSFNRASLRIALPLLLSVSLNLWASEEPARLTIVPDSGLIVLDNDTLNLDSLTEIQIAPGGHILSFFPTHTAGRWVHRYLNYPFTVGSAGQKTIDLTARAIFRIRSDPQSADLSYRGRALGRTPGEYLFLLGTGDSVLVKLEGYQTKAIDLDRVFEHGADLFVSLETENLDRAASDLQTYSYISPIKKLFTPDLLFSLGAGAALLTNGIHFNNEADKFYDQYMHLLGTKAREKAFSKARRNDRISKASFIAGDVAIGVFGYLLISRFVLKTGKHDSPNQKTHRLSLVIEPRKSGFSLKF
ncbi:MAG TPA: hypothetical protein VM123_14995 [archaeon]|nr:hypothetical protein [archaeon]